MKRCFWRDRAPAVDDVFVIGRRFNELANKIWLILVGPRSSSNVIVEQRVRQFLIAQRQAASLIMVMVRLMVMMMKLVLMVLLMCVAWLVLMMMMRVVHMRLVLMMMVMGVWWRFWPINRVCELCCWCEVVSMRRMMVVMFFSMVRVFMMLVLMMRLVMEVRLFMLVFIMFVMLMSLCDVLVVMSLFDVMMLMMVKLVIMSFGVLVMMMVMMRMRFFAGHRRHFVIMAWRWRHIVNVARHRRHIVDMLSWHGLRLRHVLEVTPPWMKRPERHVLRVVEQMIDDMALEVLQLLLGRPHKPLELLDVLRNSRIGLVRRVNVVDWRCLVVLHVVRVRLLLDGIRVTMLARLLELKICVHVLVEMMMVPNVRILNVLVMSVNWCC